MAGLLISALMFAFSGRYLDLFAFFTRPPLLYWPQFIGFVAGLWLSADNPTRVGIAAAAIPINAVIYAAIIFCATRIIVRMRRSNQPTAPASLGAREH
ncbi:MAG: hypothetical protein WAL95_16725 [Candidatus Acidiferrales bacterium]